MEAVGLAIGAISLASLFTELCKINIIKRQLMIWGESIGLLSPDEGRDGVLDEVEGHREINDVLQRISALLRDVEVLRTKYGVEVESINANEPSDCLEVSRRRRDIFKQTPIVEFLSRLVIHQRKSTIMTKTRWAIRDSKRFEAFVNQLDWFVTKLVSINVSQETQIRRDMTVREEVESIVDLSTLSIMAQTCKKPNQSWATNARNQSEYLSSGGSLVETSERIRLWNAQIEDTDSACQTTNTNGRGRKRRSHEARLSSRSRTRSSLPDSSPIRPPINDAPDPQTETYILCYQELSLLQYNKGEALLPKRTLEKLADELKYVYEGTLGSLAYNSARKKIVRRMTDRPDFQAEFTLVYGEYRHKTLENEPRAKIHVFCPPLLRCILFALALAPPDGGLTTCEFNVIIHPDIRLLCDKYGIEEGHDNLSQLQDFVRSNAEPEETTNSSMLGREREHRRQFLAARFDQVWLDQQVLGNNTNKIDSPSVSEFFKASKEHSAVALMVIMGCSKVCSKMTNTAPLVRPDSPIEQSQIYRLEEFRHSNQWSNPRWKPKYYCQIDSPLEEMPLELS